MKLNIYSTPSYSEIINLKNNLMKNPTSDSMTSSSTEIGKRVREIINTDIGPILENNIRGILENIYKFKMVPIPRKTFYKKIKFGKNLFIYIVQNKEKEVSIDDKKYKFNFNDDFSVSCADIILGKVEIIKKEKSDLDSTIILDKREIKVSRYKEIEMDGFYEFENFNINIFGDDVAILHKSVEQEDLKVVKFAAIEAKLSKKKIEDLAKQIKKDKRYLNILGKDENAIFLGFINDANTENNNYKHFLEKIKCVIYGIKKSTLCGKKVIQPIDWNLISQFNDFKSSVEKQFTDINSQLTELKKEVRGIYDYLKEKDKDKEEKEPKKNLVGKKRKKYNSEESEDNDD